MERIPDLWKETYDLVAQVPIGRVTTYGAVAKGLGDIVASRFVGLAMSRNDDIVRVPCRRVVQSDGGIGGYTGGGPEKKIELVGRLVYKDTSSFHLPCTSPRVGIIISFIPPAKHGYRAKHRLPYPA